jgi:surface-adhesin protein E
MRKNILMMLLIVVSSSAAAEWVKVGRIENVTTAFADPATIRRNGDMVKMWGLLDFKAPNVLVENKPYMSMMTQVEYDCKEEQARTLSIYFYSKNMGEGEVVDIASHSGKWVPAPPGSIAESLWKFACGKQ